MKKSKECYNCGHDIYRASSLIGEKVIKKVVAGEKIVVCRNCGAWNSP